MRNRFYGLLLAALLVTFLPLRAFAADTLDGGTVSFDGSEIVNGQNTTSASLVPGGSTTTAVSIVNSSSGTTNWYLSDDVISTLEDSRSTATGAAYSYTLSYSLNGGTAVTLYDSDTVGGETSAGGAVGLAEAVYRLNGNSGDSKYYYLGQLASGGTGVVYLTVGLDGTSMTNSYQSTAAQLALQFAVEEVTSTTVTNTRYETEVVPGEGQVIQVVNNDLYYTAPRTSDETHLWLGVVLLGLFSLGLGVCFAYKLNPAGKRRR